MSNEYKAMTVYKASAGSGKTFTLAVRFIELLIQNPESYKKTLAVTFTNKATEEMKSRILCQLYGISKRLPDSESYLKRICSDLNMNEDFVCQQAGKALTLMLHDYSNFNIETIDAFFQKVLRNLAREMNLNANLRVEIDDKEIEEKAVDQMIVNLTQDNRILTWILGYINEQMDDDKNWNVIDNIKEFGKKIFSDDYKEYAEQLQEVFDEANFFTDYSKAMKKIVSDAEDKMKEYATTFFTILENAGYSVSDFSNKEKGACGFFKKLKDGNYINDDTFGAWSQKASEGPEGWVKKGTEKKNPELFKFAEGTLVPLINEANSEREALLKDVKTAKAILENLNQLRLLNHIKEMVNTMNAEENRFLLSDTQAMLNRMMIDSDAPFIFEKIGGQLENIMIDEFQDTSTIQWKNFLVLLKNCIAKAGSKNLIVGDVKQSIYRWRNGDWNILHSQIKDDNHLTSYGYEETPLNANYRSEGNIINFNNQFFIKGAEIEAGIIADNPELDVLPAIYNENDVLQKIPASKGKEHNGLIDIRLLSNKDTDKAKYFEKVMPIVTEQLSTLFENGVKDEDISILARGNKELAQMAEYLQSNFPGHSFVSDEAFRLDASLAVNIIINAIHVLNHPNDKLAKAQLAKLYRERVIGEEVSEVLFRNSEDIDKFLPKEFVENREMLLTRPITDLAEELFRVFSLDKLDNETAYVLAFYDQLSSFAQNNNPDLELLIDTWEESMYKKTVKGGSLTGVRLLTIHKSKGLEADHILIPLCDWELDKYGSDMWCCTDKMPFGQMPVVPVNSKQIKGSHFNEQHNGEQLQVSIDNLNLLYVAFTRARKNLFVIGKRCDISKGKNSLRSALIQRTLPEIATMPEFAGAVLDYNQEDKTTDIVFTFGSLFVSDKNKELSENVFNLDSSLHEVNIKEQKNNLEFRQSNASRKFVEPDDGENKQLTNTSTGTILHNVLARIKSTDEVDKVLKEFEQEGRLSSTDSEMNRDKMAQLIKTRIESNKLDIVNRWFSNEVEIFNECTLVGYDEISGTVKEFRPDRVVRDGDTITVIDYKFGSHNDAYISQVKNYMNLLQTMGYSNVRGYLWYVYKNTIKEVNQ